MRQKMNTEKIAEFDKVSKVYGGLWPRRSPLRAVEAVSFAINSGEVFGLLGPNRAGKSTLVKLLLTICHPSSGRITRFGRSWSDRRTLARFGYIHESQALPRYLGARALLEYYGALSGVAPYTARRRSGELLERVGLADRSREPIARFSKGMLQRLALAQALINEPDVLVFDEPTEGMDLLARRLVYDAVRQQRQRGKSVILVSHALGDVEQLCDRVAVMREGRLAFLGKLDELTWDAARRSPRPLEQALEPLYEAACP
jgi:ABC-2 type transport system ATP-binding protein